MKILVADDDPLYRELAADELVKAGYKVVHAVNGEVAENLLAIEAFDAAIIDLNMPVTGGLAVIRKMRAGGPNARIPVIVITGQDDATAVSEAYEAGATSFLTKPVNWLLFTPHVAFVLRSAQSEIDLREAHATAAVLSDLKSRVLSALANDFQSPIRKIFSSSQLISKEAFGPIEPGAYREMVGDISSASQSLNASLLRLLDFGRSLSDHLEVFDEVIPARKAVLDAVGASEAKAQRRDIVLRVELDIARNVKIRADRALINQAMRGILDDAIRLSPRGAQVVIRGGIDADGNLAITTEDLGPPASSELVAEIKMANAGTRPNSHAAWTFETRDVGVRIARVLTEAHQGAMEITSRPGGPNMIRLSLPRDRVMTGSPVHETTSKAQISAESSKFADIAADIAASMAAR